MIFSRSEDYLFLNQDQGSTKQSNDQKNNRIRTNANAATSVSATNSPLLPQRNLCENTLNRMNAGSLLSVTNTSGSLHSISSDESTAAVVSLPVTTPFRSGYTANTGESNQYSASLMSLAKPILSTNGANVTKSKIPVTVSLNSLAEITNFKRPNNSSNLITTGSILSGNIIPVNINQRPLKTMTSIPDTAILNQHISSSLPSFSKHSGTGLPGLLTNVNPLSIPVAGKQRIQSPIKAVSPIDTVLSGAPGIKRTSATLPPGSFMSSNLPTDLDLLQHPGLPLDSGNSAFSSINHKLLTSSAISDVSSEPVIPTGFPPTGTVTSHDLEKEENSEDLENGVKVPTLSSGVLQVDA